MYEMKLFHHGGLCCGITYIYGFYAQPEEEIVSKTASDVDKYFKVVDHKLDSRGHPIWGILPQEKAIDRLDRYVKAVEAKRPQGIIEVVLVDFQQFYWKQVLLDYGFVQVNKSKNSNSGNTIYVWHKNTGQ